MLQINVFFSREQGAVGKYLPAYHYMHIIHLISPLSLIEEKMGGKWKRKRNAEVNNLICMS